MIPSDTPAADIVQSHTSLGFDRVPIMRDLNISFPIDRLRELVARGELGGLAPAQLLVHGRAARRSRASRARPGPRSAGACATRAWTSRSITPT